jgi:hypothetical protein
MRQRVLALTVVLSLFVFSEDLIAKERRGAQLVIQKVDGKLVKGELIAVKSASLLVLDSQSEADVAVEIGEISVINIIKKSKAWRVWAIGFGVGALFGLGYGSMASSMGEIEISVGLYVAMTAIFGVIGAIPGALIGAYLGTDKTIQIEGKSPEEIEVVMEKLRSQARVRDFQ